MLHEEYSGKIKTYVDGITRNLEDVTANEGHDLVKDSIKEQVFRLADTATHNKKYLVDMMEEFLTMLENRHDIVDFKGCDHDGSDRWDKVSHARLMHEFDTYLTWGLDAVDHFDD